MKTARMLRLLAALTSCLMLLTLLGGCSDKNGNFIYKEENKDNEEPVSLRFFGFKADAINLTAIDAAIQSFMDAHKNIELTYDCLKSDAYWEAFDKREQAGMLDDIVMMHHDHLIPLSAAGKLADLSDVPGIDRFTEAAQGQFTNADGSIYFLPTQISTYNLYVNYDLLKAHGQKTPENWAEFQQVCDYFVSKGIVPIIANNRNSLPSVAISKGLFELYQKPDAEVVATLARFDADSDLLAQELAPGLQMADEMLRRGWIDPAEVLVTGQTSDDLTLFAEGTRPFMISGGWASVRVKAKDPSFTYGVHPYPILDDGSVLSIQVDTCISVNAKSENVKEAKDFVAHLIEPDVMFAYCDTQASYSPLKDERPLTEETLTPSIPYLSNGRTVSRSEYRMTRPMETSLQSAVKVLLGGGSLAEAQSVLEQELAK